MNIFMKLYHVVTFRVSHQGTAAVGNGNVLKDVFILLVKMPDLIAWEIDLVKRWRNLQSMSCLVYFFKFPLFSVHL